MRENLEEEKKRNDQGVVISEEALKEAEKYVEEEEGPSRRLTGRMDIFITVVAVVMSLLHLYAAIGIIMTQVLRGIHVMFVLFLSFLVFPSFKRFKNRIIWYDYLLALLGIATIVYMLIDFDQFIYRSVVPNFLGYIFWDPVDSVGPGSDPQNERVDHAGSRGCFPHLCIHRADAASALDPSGIRS